MKNPLVLVSVIIMLCATGLAVLMTTQGHAAGGLVAFITGAWYAARLHERDDDA